MIKSAAGGNYDAKRTAIREKAGWGVHEVLNPESVNRSRLAGRNHHQDNLKQIRLVQQFNRIKDQHVKEAMEEERRLAKLKQEQRFGHVESKVAEFAKTGVLPPSTAASRSNSISVSSIAEDLAATSLAAPPRFPSSNDVYLPPTGRKLKLGQVPRYLLDRKTKWQTEQARVEKERQMRRDGGRPGLVLMSTEERQAIIDSLKRGLDSTQNELNRLPLIIKNQHQRERKREMENRLEQLEADIEKFSRNQKIWIAEHSDPTREYVDRANSMVSAAAAAESMSQSAVTVTNRRKCMGGSQLNPLTGGGGSEVVGKIKK